MHYKYVYGNDNEPELETFLSLPGAKASLTNAQILALNANVKLIKYPPYTGITLSSATLKMSLVAPIHVTGSSEDLRLYALISGVQFSIDDGTKAAVFSGTITYGTGETKNTNVFINGDFTTDEPAGTAWTRGTGWVITGGKAVLTANSTALTQQNALVSAGKLFWRSWDLTDYTSGQIRMYITNGISGAILTYKTVIGTYTGYVTIPTDANITIGFTDGGVGSTVKVDNANLQQITAADASGFNATAVSDAGIDPNAASFTVSITKP